MHGFANPARFLRIARWLTPLLTVTGVILVVGTLSWTLVAMPPDHLMGASVKILPLHVPSAWLGMAGWISIAIASFIELVWRHPLANIAGRASAMPGAVFTFLCLVTGSIWGRPTWGTWWVWDGRLTSMLVLLFLYIGYIALSGALAREGSSTRITAIYGLVGAINVPIINKSVVWWNSLHQQASLTFGKDTLANIYLVPLLISTLGFTLLFGGVVLMRMRAILADVQSEARLRRKAMQVAQAGPTGGEPGQAGETA